MAMRFDTSKQPLGDIFAEIEREAGKRDVIITVTKKSSSRSIEQNALLHARISEFSNHTGQRQDEVKAWLKLKLAAPILARDDADFDRRWRAIIGPLGYVDRLQVAEIMPMTSIMTVSQVAELLDSFAQVAGEQGLVFRDLQVYNDFAG